MNKDIRMFQNHCKGMHMSPATIRNNNRKSENYLMSTSQLLKQPNIHGNGHLLEQQFNTGDRFFNAREDFKMNKSSKLFRLGLVGAVVVSITFGQSIPEQQVSTEEGP